MPRKKMTTAQRELLCKLLEAAMEGKSYAQYAKDAGVSASNITRIKKSEYPPHPDFLKKMTSPRANPANNVTYEMLRDAVGLENEDVDEEQSSSRYDSECPNEEEIFIKNRLRLSTADGHYDIKCLGIICATLFKLGISYFNVKTGKEIGLRYLKPDIMMSLPAKGNKGMFWLIENMVNPRYRIVNVERYLCGCILEVSNPQFKVSVVVSDLELFKHTITTYKNRISYRGDLSIILVDLDKDQVVDEVYLSHYYEEEKKQKKTEFYITETNDSES